MPLFDENLIKDLEIASKEISKTKNKIESEMASIKEKHKIELEKKQNDHKDIKNKIHMNAKKTLQKLFPKDFEIIQLNTYDDGGFKLLISNTSVYSKISFIKIPEKKQRQYIFYISYSTFVFDEKLNMSKVEDEVDSFIRKIEVEFKNFSKYKLKQLFNEDIYYTKKNKPKLVSLTDLEKKVFSLHVQGFKNNEIALKIGRTKNIIDHIVWNVSKKFNNAF